MRVYPQCRPIDSLPDTDDSHVPLSLGSCQPEPHDLTLLLGEWRRGDHQALDRLLPAVYDELRRLASRYLSGERAGHTLQTSDLVHEAYLRLIDQHSVDWQNRTHFFAISASMMRRVLVDHARSRGGRKRGGDFNRIALDDVPDLPPPHDADFVAVDQALRELGTDHPQLGWALVGYGELLVVRGAAGDAEPNLSLGLEILRSALGEEHWRTAEAKSLLGAAFAGLGRDAEAEPLLRSGHDALAAQRGPEHRLSRQARERLTRFYEARGRGGEAAGLRDGEAAGLRDGPSGPG